MKPDKDDIRRTGEDLDLIIIRHGDAMKHNPDLAAETMKLRSEWLKRYDEVSEKKPE